DPTCGGGSPPRLHPYEWTSRATGSSKRVECLCGTGVRARRSGQSELPIGCLLSLDFLPGVKRTGRIMNPPRISPFAALISHSKDAESCVRDRRVERGAEAEREVHAGVDRVDDAVVPEAGGAVVGAAFALVLLKGRR